jgi:hypothetical protein
LAARFRDDEPSERANTSKHVQARRVRRALARRDRRRSRASWGNIVDKHLVPAFGDLFVDQLRPSDIKGWQTRVAAKIKAGDKAT